MTAAEVVRIAESWVGTKYDYGCSVKGVGVDCAKFGLGVYKEAGLVPSGVQAPHQYRDWTLGKDVDPHVFRDFILRFADPVAYDDRQPGDLITFKFNGIESHVAVMVEDDCVIHAQSGTKVKKQRLRRIKSVCAVYRHKDIQVG